MLRILLAVTVSGVAATPQAAMQQKAQAPAKCVTFEKELGAANAQIKTLSVQLAQMEAALAKKPVAAVDTRKPGQLTWAESTAFFTNTFEIQQAILTKLYSMVIKPEHIDALGTHQENIKKVAGENLEKGKEAARKLFDEHAKKHYDEHVSPHVEKGFAVVGEHVENFQNLYKLHLEEKVEAHRGVVSEKAFGMWLKAQEVMMVVPNKIHDAVNPKIDAVVAQFPDQAHHIPDALHDRLLLFTAVLGLFVVYLMVSLRVVRFALRLCLGAVKLAFSVFKFFLLLPFKILCCGFCRKRAVVAAPTTNGKNKQSFRKPSSNGSNSNGMLPKKKR